MQLKKEKNNSKPLTIIRASAASGNLGPGFDVAGLSLKLFNEFRVYMSDSNDYTLRFEGEFAGCIRTDHNNLVIKAIRIALNKYLKKINDKVPVSTIEKPLKIIGKINIPVSKGFSSSASAIVSGLMMANKIYDLNMQERELFLCGLELENHPDGLAACLAGGLVICYRKEGIYHYKKIEIRSDLKILLMIPGYEVNTKIARKLIPTKIPIENCINNLSNFFLLIESLKQGNLGETTYFIKDYLHQNYRKKLYTPSLKLVEDLNNKWRIPAAISGAGSAVIGIMDKEIFERYNRSKESILEKYPDFKLIITSVNNKGSYYL